MSNEVTRGNMIKVRATFYDADGASFSPTSTYLSYKNGSVAVQHTDMTLVGSKFEASIGTFSMDAGPLYFAVHGRGGSYSAAHEGEYTIRANPGNV